MPTRMGEIPSNGNEASSQHVGLRFYAEEFVWFVRMGGPLSATYLFNFLQSQVVVAFAGHLSVEELGALGLTITYYTLSVSCVAVALGNAFSGRFGASYGAARIDLLVDDLHRSILLAVFVLFGEQHSPVLKRYTRIVIYFYFINLF